MLKVRSKKMNLTICLPARLLCGSGKVGSEIQRTPRSHAVTVEWVLKYGAHLETVPCPTYDVQRTMSNVRCPTYDVQHTMSTVRCPTYDVHRTMSTVRCPTYDVQGTMSNVRCPTYDAHRRMSTVRCPRYDVHRTCLLYTSPSPRDRTRYRMPSSA